jgi:hypothetical protein
VKSLCRLTALIPLSAAAALLWSCVIPADFDSAVWKADPAAREAMILFLIREPILQSKTEEEIEAALGKPDRKTEDAWLYAFDDGGILGIRLSQPYFLVRFDSGKRCSAVTTVE